MPAVIDIAPAPTATAPATHKLLTRAELDAYDAESESWQKQFQRRYTHHADLKGVLNHVEDVDDTVYGKFAVAVKIGPVRDRALKSLGVSGENFGGFEAPDGGLPVYALRKEI